MERHIQTFLNRLSCASITIATVTLLSLFLRAPQTCLPPPETTAAAGLPRSSCHAPSRALTTLEKRNARLWSTRAWRDRVSSHARLFAGLPAARNDSRVLCVSAGAGHAAAALGGLGVADVTAVELVASPPLVSRADPHDLPFSDGAFDLAFGAEVAEALFPDRAAAEMERAVRLGGLCVAVVEETGPEGVSEIAGLFRRSELVQASNVTLAGSRVTSIVMSRIKI